MPQGIQDLPPPAVEWRRESDDERRQRLIRSGIVQPNGPVQPDGVSGQGSGLREGVSPVQLQKNELFNEIDNLSKSVRQNLHYWFNLEAARWSAMKSPKKTSTVTNGSFGLSVEVSRSAWRWKGFDLGFGPTVVYFNGGQFAELVNSPIQGQGYADFSSCELGGFVNFVRSSEGATSHWHPFFSVTTSYLPVRFITAESQSLGGMNARSDTYSRTSLSLPGLGIRLSVGGELSRFAKGELFYGLQGAWPLQLRSRMGVQISMGLTAPDAGSVVQ